MIWNANLKNRLTVGNLHVETFFLTFFGLAYRQRIESPCDEYEICLFDVCVVPCRANETIGHEFFA